MLNKLIVFLYSFAFCGCVTDPEKRTVADDHANSFGRISTACVIWGHGRMGSPPVPPQGCHDGQIRETVGWYFEAINGECEQAMYTGHGMRAIETCVSSH